MNAKNKKVFFLSIAIVVVILALILSWLTFSSKETFRQGGALEVGAESFGDINTIEEMEGDFSAMISKNYLLRDPHGNLINFAETESPLLIRYEGEDSFSPLHVHTHVHAPVSGTTATTGQADGFVFNIWPSSPSGNHLIRVTDERGSVHDIDFYWSGTNEIFPVELVEQTNTESVFMLQDIDISDFETMLHVYPSGNVQELTPRGERFLRLSQEGLEEGDHVFLIKQNDAWHYAVINNPENF